MALRASAGCVALSRPATSPAAVAVARPSAPRSHVAGRVIRIAESSFNAQQQPRYRVISKAAPAVVKSGVTTVIHAEADVNTIVESNKEKLIIAMCKSSTCKPCKAFMPTYQQYAERFCDAVLLEVTGDESPELRALMKKWQVKATPTFRFFRNGEMVEQFSGTGGNKLLNGILRNLKDGERGRDWVDVTHEENQFNTVDKE